MDFFNCKSLDDALDIVKNQLSVPALPPEVVPLLAAIGRTCAEDQVSAEDVPPFCRSTVDGYAVMSRDTFGAGENNPVWLSLCGEILMGKPAECAVESGQAVAIPTGGMLPAGADAVVMLEHTELAPEKRTIFICKPVAPGENVITRGEDITKGTVIVRCGRQITPRSISALAACGITQLQVCQQVQAAIISTGDELVDIACNPDYGEIRDINSYALAAMLQREGCSVNRIGIIKDQYEDIFGALTEAIKKSHIVIVSGGSSVGARDHTVKAIEALGLPGVLLHGLAVKPGKPTIFGMAGAVPVFGLPGHPVSAITICEQLVIPAVKLLAGRKQEGLFTVKARLTRNVASAPGRDDFVKVQLIKNGEEYLAEPILGKSGLVSTLMRADGMVRIGSSKSGLYKDEAVDVIVFD